jgi:hypothetical protein
MSNMDDKSQVNARELLGDPVSVGPFNTRADAERTGFELYREAAIVVAVASHLYVSENPKTKALTRDQAVCVGLLVRIAKFMSVVLRLASGDKYGDVVLALNRCILESATNLEFLAKSDSAELFEKFRRHSLGPERELYDTIQKNISGRDGEVWPIEKRMLRSIDRS